MKNPLTSKERRGLTAVAAAALLCIGTGFVARSCGSLSSKGASTVVVDGYDSVSDFSEKSEYSEHSDISEKSDSVNGKRARREKRRQGEKKQPSKKKAEKSYPVRDPLSQPCD